MTRPKDDLRLDVYLHFGDGLVGLPAAMADAVAAILRPIITQQGDRIMASVAELNQAITDLGFAVDAENELLGRIHQELVDALQANDPAAIQVAIDNIAALRQRLTDATTANPDPTP